MIFEEALLKTDSIKKMYSIEEVTALRKNDLKAYAEIKDNLYCPECEQPHLTHKLCSEKANHFATHIGEEHTEECSFKSEFEHININEGDCFTCFLAFYAKLETNLYNGITYFNCILTDSRKMIFVKTP